MNSKPYFSANDLPMGLIISAFLFRPMVKVEARTSKPFSKAYLAASARRKLKQTGHLAPASGSSSRPLTDSNQSDWLNLPSINAKPSFRDHFFTSLNLFRYSS